MTKVDQNGTTHTYSFDLLGRMTADAVTLASGNPQNVDTSVLRIETSYNTQGLLDTITSFDATSGGNITNQVQNVYNGLGQLTTQYQEHAGAVNTSTSLHVDYGYSDLAHGARLASLTYPNGRVLTYNYGTSSSLDDSISRLTSLSDGNTTLESYAYLGLGTVVERDHPESGANLTYIKQTGESDGDAGDQYTGLDRFTRVVDQRWMDGSGTALDRYRYTYDRNSNRLTKSNSLNGNLSESYSYDDLNRLANMTRGGSAYQSWDLDGLGNMNSVTTGNVTETRTHNDQNQLLTMGNATLAFDNNGNTVTDDQGHTLVYDAWNRLMVVKSGTTLLKSYSYDGQGWRISETPAGGTATDLYYSSQWQVLEERQSGNATAQYAWSPVYVDALIARDRDTNADGTLDERLYALQDANFNVTGIVNTIGIVVERYVLDPYGAASINDSGFVQRNGNTSAYGWQYLFQGKRRDYVAELDESRGRVYGVALQRWLQPEPYGGIYVSGPNLYRSFRNNSMVWLDSAGLADEKPPIGPIDFDPEDHYRSIDKAQKKHKQNKPNQDEWDGVPMPKQDKIRSTEKSRKRADYDNQNNLEIDPAAPALGLLIGIGIALYICTGPISIPATAAVAAAAAVLVVVGTPSSANAAVTSAASPEVNTTGSFILPPLSFPRNGRPFPGGKIGQTICDVDASTLSTKITYPQFVTPRSVSLAYAHREGISARTFYVDQHGTLFDGVPAAFVASRLNIPVTVKIFEPLIQGDTVRVANMVIRGDAK